MRILVTGASGYVGGRLVPALLAAGHEVRAMSRTAGWLRDYPWADQVEQVSADVLDPAAVRPAVTDIDVVYYLIHSMSSGARFAERDRQAAHNLADAARAAGVKRIVYLGGLTDERADLSAHLASRAEVGQILLDSGVPTIVLRAAMILGSGSASFEMLRYLTERLPMMITPRWVRTRTQPIAVRDVLHYLVGCADLPAGTHGRFDIVGPDVLTYRQMMQRYAVVAGLHRRVIVAVPLLSLRLSSLWIGLVTPLPTPLARPLVDSLRVEVVGREHEIARLVPDPPAGLTGFDEAIRLALHRTRDAQVTTRWSQNEWPGAPSDPLPNDPDWAGGNLLIDERQLTVVATAERTWAVVSAIGGTNGWYSMPFAWTVRGWADRLVGGVGLRRGRRDQSTVRIGDALDWWRVEDVMPPTLLRLRAEMRVPGLAWLEFHIEALGAPGRGSTCRLTQRATFYPHGLAGHLYWRLISPFHNPIFQSMIENLARAAETTEPEREAAPAC
jgi:uncharacterized protein YbjT (DUF2867 family)